jgi:2-aminobenzoate-CoA ligase
MDDGLARYFNELLYRMEEVFHHELSDCASWKTEFVGTDFIQRQNIRGANEQELIRSCIESIKSAGLAEDIEFSIGGKGILLKLDIKGCPLMPKESMLRKAGIKPYNCPATNMILDQLIEKLGYATAYVADLSVDEQAGRCRVKAAIYATPDKVGEVSDWSAEDLPPHVGTGPSAHVDTFTRDHLPPADQRPEFLFELPELRYAPKLNCAEELLDMAVAGAHADRPAIHAPAREGKTVITYREMLARSNQIANFLTDDLGLLPGNRVLLRSANNPMLAQCLFGVWKAGGVAVPTMRLLRAKELRHIIDKATVEFALCDIRLRDEMEAAAAGSPVRIVYFNGDGPHSLEALIQAKSEVFDNVATAADDVALIAFTSGTTGHPKGAMHFHRDVLAMCDCWPGSILKPNEDDIFCGTAPLAFTYGLGTMLCIPMRFGGSTVLVEQLTPATLLATIQDFRATFCATVPTFFLQMAPLARAYDLSSLRRAVSSGEALPDATRQQFRQASGLELIDGLGTTEMIQTFLSHGPGRARQGATGYVIPGYRASVLDAEGKPCPPGVVGRLAVKGPTGCLYLDDEQQQKRSVQGGWNITGDAYVTDEDGYFHPRGRTDDMIVSAGYNIDGLEIESVLLEHEAVAECAVVGVPDAARGSVVNAFIVLKPGFAGGTQTAEALQDYVKSAIAPYKYPRRIQFVASLPRTETGKLQRFKLVQAACET